MLKPISKHLKDEAVLEFLFRKFGLKSTIRNRKLLHLKVVTFKCFLIILHCECDLKSLGGDFKSWKMHSWKYLLILHFQCQRGCGTYAIMLSFNEGHEQKTKLWRILYFRYCYFMLLLPTTCFLRGIEIWANKEKVKSSISPVSLLQAVLWVSWLQLDLRQGFHIRKASSIQQYTFTKCWPTFSHTYLNQ